MKKRLVLVLAVLAGFVFTACDLPAHFWTTQKRILEELEVPRAVIINADDFGMMDTVNDAILESLYGKGGIVSSVSVQSTASEEEFKNVAKLIRENPSMDIGVHVTLVSAKGHMVKPVSHPKDVPSLIDPATGCFYEENIPFYNSMVIEEVDREIRAQIERVVSIDRENIKISHINSHYGTLDCWSVFNGHEDLQLLFLDIAAEYRVPVRWYFDYRDWKLVSRGIITATSAINTITDVTLKDEDIDRVYVKRRENFKNMLNNLKDGIIEIFCHPADERSVGNDGWRRLDGRLVRDPEIIDFIKKKVEDGELAVIGYKTLMEKMQ